MSESHDHTHCPVEGTIRLLQPKWTLHIVHELQGGKQRFNQLASNLGGVNPRTLCQRLRELEEHDIVEREILSSVPPWVEYSLTSKGEALSSVIASMNSWGSKWLSQSTCEEESTSAADRSSAS